MASYEGGRLTASDIDAHILRLPADDRPAPAQDLDAWYEDLVRTLVVDRELLEQARENGLAHADEFRLHRRATERRLAVGACLEEFSPELSVVTQDELEAAYAEREEAFVAPERRSVFHIYRQLEPGIQLGELKSEMQALRERILRGESFQRVAQAESDSESRHRQGGIGWIVRGQLPEEFEETIFALEAGVPSQPIVASDGIHLFKVEDVLPQRQLSRSEVAPSLRSELQAAKAVRAFDELVAANASPSVTMVDREKLDRLLEQNSGQEIVLAGKDYSLSLAELRQHLGRMPGQEQTRESGLSNRGSHNVIWQFLNHLYRHEVAYEYCTAEGLVAPDVIEDQLAEWERRTLTNRMRERRLRERVMADPDRLQLFYQSNIGQFTPPVQWHLKRLRIPFDTPAAGRALMKRLEMAAATEPTGLEPLQRELGGELEMLGWKTMQEMGAINSKLPQRVSPLQKGALVAPLRVNDRIELYRVGGRRQFDPTPFEQVRERVASAYLRQYTKEVYDAFESDLLERVDFELYAERLDELRDGGLPSGTEISVEELDALLGGE